MPLTSGTRLGPYEIQLPVGTGGMGEVYRARDTRLDRTFAIKILPAAVSSDPDRLLRFQHEARILSTLNHPNVLAIFDIGEQNEVRYLVSEFLEGQSMREVLGAGALPRRKATEYALEIAKGLAAAHEKGVVHRDLKPDNIFITRDERVKILDFGLAKQTLAESAAEESPTMTVAASTTPGTVMGTVGYMSPDQVRGQTVDHRSDIFSFGAVLYEMVSGKRAFSADSSVETMNAILKEDVAELSASGGDVSPGLDRILRRCLEKKPERRFQSASDLAFAIEALSVGNVTANYFDLLGVKPLLGRFFLPEEETRSDAVPYIVLGYSIWKTRYTEDPEIVGKAIEIARRPVTVIGVAPEGFIGAMPGVRQDAWLPLNPMGANEYWMTHRNVAVLNVLGRLRPGMSREQATQDLEMIMRRIVAAYPNDHLGTNTITLDPMWRSPFGANVYMAATLPILLAIAGVVLLLTCANVATLTLVRFVSRRREIAIRQSLGAQRVQLVRQMVLEGIILSAGAGAVALLLTSLTAKTFARFIPANSNPIALNGTVDQNVVIGIVVLAALASVLSGALPAWRSSNVPASEVLKDESSSISGGSHNRRLLSGLVVAQIALSLALLVISGLFLQTLRNLSERPAPMVYMSYFQRGFETIVQVRTQGNPNDIAPAVESAIHEIDGQLPVFDIRSMRETTQMATIFAVMQSTFAGILAAIALILATTGIYGVVAYRTALRTHEIGIRVALGASPDDVLRLVLMQGLSLTAIGLSLGLALSFSLAHFIAAWLYGVGANDPLTVIVVMLLLGAMSVLACFFPARRATRVDPVAAIRAS